MGHRESVPIPCLQRWLPEWGEGYLSIVEVAEAPDFFGLVEDVAVDFHVAHDAQFSEVG